MKIKLLVRSIPIFYNRNLLKSIIKFYKNNIYPRKMHIYISN